MVGVPLSTFAVFESFGYTSMRRDVHSWPLTSVKTRRMWPVAYPDPVKLCRLV